MTSAPPLILVVIVVISFTASAQEVGYAYGDFGGRPLGWANLSEYNGTDEVTSTIASAAYDGKTTSQRSIKRAEDMKKEINLKLNVRNPVVIDKGCSLVLDYPGDGTIGQICSIYEYMVGKWSYKRDPRGIEVFQYSNQSLKYGNGKYSGQGDCDDFSILLASLIESIGCTSRIVLAYGPNGGHAYAEVYLGKAGGPESDVVRMLSWLKKKYKVEEINTNKDLRTGDVWLNLDWWREPGGAKHPGGPFFRAAEQVPIWIREDIPWVPLKPMNELPIAQFSISPLPPVVGGNTSFDASSSRDIGGRIESYLWDFGDGNKTENMSEPDAIHVYSKGGPCMVNLTVWDDEDAANVSSQKIMINNPPQAYFTIEPQRPKVGDQVKFDASDSWDAEDGKLLAYHWEINNSSDTFNQASPPKQVYDNAGMHWINLTVSDSNGAVGRKNYLLKINQPPIARMALNSANLSLGRMINFTAGLSEDPDGEIVGYTWDFGDNSRFNCNKTAFHRYQEGGEKTVQLSVRDNDGAMSNISQDIIINYPPIAIFTIDPENPKKGEIISFNASSSFDEDGDILKYSWDFGEGKIEPEVYASAFAVHAYYRLQEYNVTLVVEDDKGATGSSSQSFGIGEINGKPSIISLKPDSHSPMELGTIVKWTTTASDPENDPLQFLFSMDGQVMRDWSNSSIWSWIATKGRAGEHVIEVKVRDGNHAGPDSSDDGKTLSFVVNNPALDSGIQRDSSDSVETLTNSSHSYTGITLHPYAVSNAIVDYTATGQSASHPTINTTSIAKYSNSSIVKSIVNATPYLILIGGLLASDYYSASQCLSCANTTDIEFAAVHDGNSTFWLKRGDELFALGKCDDAIMAYNKSYTLDLKNAKPLFGKGRALFAKGKYEEALFCLTAAIELDPHYKLSNSAYADMWIYKGKALKKLGRDMEADLAFLEAEDLDPSSHPELEDVVESCA
jgi:PKD repeat protein